MEQKSFFEIEVCTNSQERKDQSHLHQQNESMNCDDDEIVIKSDVDVPLIIKTDSNIEDSQSEQNSNFLGTSNYAKYSSKEHETKAKVNLFIEDHGPKWYKVTNNVVTPCIESKNLPKVFEDFPIFYKPACRADIENFYDRKIRQFVGDNLDDEEYNELKNYCSVEHLKTGRERIMSTNVPQSGKTDFNLLNKHIEDEEEEEKGSKETNMFVLKKLETRLAMDKKKVLSNRLKYRAVRVMPLSMQEKVKAPGKEFQPPELEPGKDLLFHVRVYKPFHSQNPFDGSKRTRQSVFSCDIVLTGRQMLTVLRDRIVCPNDFDLRIDVSSNPDGPSQANCKGVFPSGFLFINNVFYVDNRAGCTDHSRVLRTWAQKRGKGTFKHRDMDIKLLDVPLRLGHPEVYIHQGNCEHLFMFSEIRLLNYSDPLHLSCYPCHTLISHNHMLYCTTCAEFSAKWIVTNCDRVPFNPALFCDVCFRQYLYKDGEKIGDFKAYYFRGNEINICKTSLNL